MVWVKFRPSAWLLPEIFFQYISLKSGGRRSKGLNIKPPQGPVKKIGRQAVHSKGYKMIGCTALLPLDRLVRDSRTSGLMLLSSYVVWDWWRIRARKYDTGIDAGKYARHCASNWSWYNLVTSWLIGPITASVQILFSLPDWPARHKQDIPKQFVLQDTVPHFWKLDYPLTIEDLDLIPAYNDDLDESVQFHYFESSNLPNF